jgi:uncharacterized protein YndB with AHSA1/START domain
LHILSTTTTDRIEKHVQLRAPRARVWQALADARQFGSWFGVAIEGSFAPGARVQGRITHPGYEHVPFDIAIERMEPERLMSWRWHPGSVEATDSEAPTTLVVFELEEVDGGTRLTVVESGFDALPPERRAAAYRGNDDGWTQQMVAIERHVSAAGA